MTRRGFLGCAAAGLAARPLNIVLILADDLGWADLGCYGGDLVETSHLDRLARESVRFTDAYAAAPVCSPTRASILTGKSPARLHMTTWLEASGNPPRDRKLTPPVTTGNLPLAEVTLAERLRERGYLTALVGKWHLGNAEHYPETQGFDINIGGTLWGAPPTYFHPYRGEWRPGGEYRYVPHLEGGKPGEYLTDRLTDEALRIIDSARGRPYFLYLAHHAVHTPIEARAPAIERYRSRLKAGMHHQNVVYAAMVASLDESVGRILERVDSNTVVVFTSDNGGYVSRFREQPVPVTSNYPLRSGKGALYEGGIRVPLMVRWPGVTSPGICEEPVVSTDLFATLLGLDGSQDGLSLAPLLRNPRSRLAREELYFHYPHYYPTTTPVSAVRARQWKLLEFLEDGHVELYDLARDIGERNDLAGQMPDRAAELRRKLHAWRAAVAAQMPTR